MSFTAERVDRYIWRGIFRRYSIYIYYERGDDPTVLSVTNRREKTADETFPPPSVEALSEAKWRALEIQKAHVIEVKQKPTNDDTTSDDTNAADHASGRDTIVVDDERGN